MPNEYLQALANLSNVPTMEILGFAFLCVRPTTKFQSDTNWHQSRNYLAIFKNL